MKKLALIAVAAASLFSASTAFAGYFIPNYAPIYVLPTCGWTSGFYGPVWVCS